MIDPINEIIQRIIRKHIFVGKRKSLSYLPIDTVKRILKMAPKDYQRMITLNGNKAIIVYPEESCLESGAIFAYSEIALSVVLERNGVILRTNDWPSTCEDFIKKVAAEWVDQASPIMPVIKEAFGD